MTMATGLVFIGPLPADSRIARASAESNSAILALSGSSASGVRAAAFRCPILRSVVSNRFPYQWKRTPSGTSGNSNSAASRCAPRERRREEVPHRERAGRIHFSELQAERRAAVIFELACGSRPG